MNEEKEEKIEEKEKEETNGPVKQETNKQIKEGDTNGNIKAFKSTICNIGFSPIQSNENGTGNALNDIDLYQFTPPPDHGMKRQFEMRLERFNPNYESAMKKKKESVVGDGTNNKEEEGGSNVGKGEVGESNNDKYPLDKIDATSSKTK